MQTSRVTEWVQLCEKWCEPDWTHWCDGSPRDLARLTKMVQDSPSAPAAAAFMRGKCVAPAEAMQQIALKCRGSLRGRIMFVVPYLLPGDDPGLLVTDSAVCAAHMCRIASVGTEALDLLATGREFAAQLHLNQGESEGDSEGSGVLSIRCHLSGPAVIETACRTEKPQRRSLPMETVSPAPAADPNCAACGRLCPNRARAIAATASRNV